MPLPGTPPAISTERMSCMVAAAAFAFGESTGTSASTPPVPSRTQVRASPITSSRCVAVRPPRPWPTKTTVVLVASVIAIG